VTLAVLFAIYLVLLVWIVLWKLETPWIGAAAGLPRPLKLVPFVASGDAGASQPQEVAINALLFVPFGMFLGLLAPRWRWWTSTALFAAASLVLETTQHLISTGSFDTTDIITNTAGGMAGLGLLWLIRRRLRGRTAAVMTRILLVATVVAVLAVAAFVASPISFGPHQHDYVVSSRPHPREPLGP
jgi:glycopeptide antibiotics resistance protein